MHPCILHLTPSRTKVLLLAHHLECGEAAQTLDTVLVVMGPGESLNHLKTQGIPSGHHGFSYAKSWSDDNWMIWGYPWGTHGLETSE